MQLFLWRLPGSRELLQTRGSASLPTCCDFPIRHGLPRQQADIAVPIRNVNERVGDSALSEKYQHLTLWFADHPDTVGSPDRIPRR